MCTIFHIFAIAAPRDAVFDALTTADGLAGWWTTNVRADMVAVGSHLDVTFGGLFNPHLRVTALDSPTHVAWEGAGGHAAWGAITAIRFDLEATSGGTTVWFRHQIGSELSEDAVARANFNWGYYLNSLRLLCETGSGTPFQTGVAGARVGVNRIGEPGSTLQSRAETPAHL